MNRSGTLEVFLGKCALEICSKFTGECPCGSATSIKLRINFVKTTLWHECSPVNSLHIFRAPFPKNTSGGLLLDEAFQNKINFKWGNAQKENNEKNYYKNFFNGTSW